MNKEDSSYVNKYKVEIIIGIVVILILSNVSVLSTTITQTDLRTSTSDSDLVIDYDDSWIRMGNGTVDNHSLSASVFNQWDNAYSHRGDYNNTVAADITNDMMLGWNASNATLIRNSNGNYWAIDGTADDVQIQVAIDDCTDSNGGTVWIPSGDIDFNAKVDLASNVNIIGAGFGVTKINLSGSMDGDRTGFLGNGINNFSIQSLSMDGLAQNVKYLIAVSNVQDCTFRDLRLNGTSDAGFYSDSVPKRMTLDNIHVTGVIDVGGHTPYQCFTFSRNKDCTYNNLYAYDIIDADVAIDWANCNSISINNIYIDLEGGAVANKGIKCGGSDTYPASDYNMNNINIKNTPGTSTESVSAMYFENNINNVNVNNLNIVDGGGLRVQDNHVYTNRLRNINFNNVYVNNSIDDSDAYGVMVFGAENVSFNNLVTDDCFGRALWFEDAKNITVTNGRFSEGGLSSKLETSRDVSFSQCVWKDNRNTRCFEIIDSTNWSITDCKFLNNAGDAIRTNVGTTGCQYWSITNCVFKNNGDEGIDMGSLVDEFIITGNLFVDDTVDSFPSGAGNYIFSMNMNCTG